MDREGAGSIALAVLLFVLIGAAIAVMSIPGPAGVAPPFIYAGLTLWFGGYFVILGLMLKG